MLMRQLRDFTVRLFHDTIGMISSIVAIGTVVLWVLDGTLGIDPAGLDVPSWVYSLILFAAVILAFFRLYLKLAPPLAVEHIETRPISPVGDGPLHHSADEITIQDPLMLRADFIFRLQSHEKNRAIEVSVNLDEPAVLHNEKGPALELWMTNVGYRKGVRKMSELVLERDILSDVEVRWTVPLSLTRLEEIYGALAKVRELGVTVTFENRQEGLSHRERLKVDLSTIYSRFGSSAGRSSVKNDRLLGQLLDVARRYYQGSDGE